MNRYPKLTTPLDCYPVGSFLFLAAYPNFLALGRPSAYYNFQFCSNSYIKLLPASLQKWHKPLREILSVFYQDLDISSGIVVEETHFPKFCIKWEKPEGLSNSCMFDIKVEFPFNTTKFTLAPLDIYDLVKGFECLLVKPLCLPFFVDSAIFQSIWKGQLEKDWYHQ